MAKLIITVEEQIEKLEGDRTLFGFAVTHDIDFEGAERSLLPSMGPTLTEFVMRAIAMMQRHNGGHLHKTDTCDRSTPLESHMTEIKTKLEQPFPSEL